MSTIHHDITTPAPPQLQEVDDGVFAYIQPDGTWWINNTGFLVGQRGVISIDTCATVRRTRAYLDAIRTVTPQPVRTVVNTHHHGDHTFGNFLFAGATIVGHEATRAGVLDWGEPKSAPFWTEVDWGEIVLEPPFLTYTDSVTVWVDDLRADVRHVGVPAHTTNDSIVWLPERKVLYCGDLLFNGGTPFLVQGSVAGAIEVLEKVVRPLGATTIVPGHGPWPDRNSSTTSWGTCASFRPVPAPATTPASHRWRPHANWTWDSTPTYSTRTHRRQPAPGLRRTRRRALGRAHRRRRGSDRHGHLQRRPPPQLPCLRAGGATCGVHACLVARALEPVVEFTAAGARAAGRNDDIAVPGEHRDRIVHLRRATDTPRWS